MKARQTQSIQLLQANNTQTSHLSIQASTSFPHFHLWKNISKSANNQKAGKDPNTNSSILNTFLHLIPASNF